MPRMQLFLIYRWLPCLLLPTVTPLSLPNLINPGGALSLANVSGALNVSDGHIDPKILPFSYKVPFTDMTLRLGFGIFKRQPLDGREMNRLLSEAQEEVDKYIKHFGPHEPIPLGPDKSQGWSHWMASGNGPLEICIGSWKTDARETISWGQVAVVLEGLKTYLIDGKRYWVTSFNFAEEVPWLRPGILGVGFIRQSNWKATTS